MPRETDPEARRLLAEVERLEEQEPWPAALHAYACALLALGQQCEARAGKAEVYRWAARRLHGQLSCRDYLSEWRGDALGDVVATVAGMLWRYRATLDPGRPPNLRSMLSKAVDWRAKDIAKSTHRRHSRRQAEGAEQARLATGSAATTAYAREVYAMLAAGEAPARALLLIGQGESIAEAARRTGASRQQIYRARELLRAKVEGAPTGAGANESSTEQGGSQ